MNYREGLFEALDDDVGQSVSNRCYPLRFLGMGLLIAWLCCTHVVDIFPGDGFSTELRTVFDYGMRTGDIGTFLVLAFLSSSIMRLSWYVKANSIFVCVSSIGTAALGYVLIPYETSQMLVFLLSVITAIGGAILFCLWAEVCCQIGMTRAVVYGAASCIVGTIMFLLIGSIRPPFAVVAVSLLPVFSYACAMMSISLLPTEKARPSSVRYPLPWKLLGIMGAASLLSGLAGSLLPSAEGLGAVHRVLATGLAGVIIISMVTVRKERIDIRVLAKVTLPLAVLALAFVPFAGPLWGYVVSFLLKLAYVWFTLFSLLMLVNLAYRFEAPSLKPFAIARALSEGFLFVGVAACRIFQECLIANNPIFLIAFAVGGILLVLFCSLVWTSEISVNSDWGAAGVSLSCKVHVVSPRERFLQRVEEISTRYKLTDRESEIMGLVAQHKTRSDIEHELFLSQNTVKTHLRHLYSKLDIHSKADIIKLLNNLGD